MNNNPENILEISEKIMARIKEGDSEAVLFDIRNWSKSTSIQIRRMYKHFLGKILLVQGDFDGAIKTFQNAINTEGPHILIYAELVASYYLNKQYLLWILASSELQNQLNQVHGKINTVNKFRAELILAKSLELQGSIAEAYKLYIKIYNAPILDFKIKGLCQIVRLEAQYPIGNNFGIHYLALQQFNLNTDQPDYNCDILHSLMLAEAEHIDIQKAIKTFQKIPKNQSCFFALGYYELLDLMLPEQPEALTLIEKQFGKIDPISISDSKLKLLAQGIVPHDWYNWSHEMPLTPYLRLVRLFISKLSDQDRALCLAQLRLLLSALSNDSFNYWKSYYKNLNELNFITIPKTQINWNQDGLLRINNININLRKKSALVKLIDLVYKAQKISTDDLCKFIWMVELDSYHLDRIRQLVYRINKITKEKANCKLLNFSLSYISFVNFS